MAIGTHKVDVTGTPTALVGGNFTVTDTVSFNQPVKLRSVLARFYSNGTFNGYAVIYSAAGTLIASGPVQSLTISNSSTAYEIPFTSAIDLDANTQYKIGYYSGSGAQPGVISGGSAGATFNSSPTYNVMTRANNSVLYLNGTGNPTATYGVNQHAGGYSFDATIIFGTPSGPANNSTINNKTSVNFTWTSTGAAQTGYEIIYRELGSKDLTWTSIINLSSSSSTVAVPANTFEDGVSYEWTVYLYSVYGKGPAVLRYNFTASNGWTTQTEVTSSSTTGVIDASAFTVGNYDVQVRTSDSNGYGPWSTLQTFTLGPPTNVYVKISGTMKQSLVYVKQGGVWKQVPPKKVRSGGSF